MNFQRSTFDVQRSTFYLCSLILLTASSAARAQTNSSPTTRNSQLEVIQPAVIQFDRASLLFQKNQYAEAPTEFTSLARQYPQSTKREEALYRLAECYRLLRRPQDAQLAYAFVLAQYPDGKFKTEAQVRRGELLYALQQYDEAIKVLRPANKTENSDLRQTAQYFTALSQLKTKKETEARETLELLSTTKPPGDYAAPAAQALAESWEQANQLPEALAVWQRTLALSSDKITQSMAAARGGRLALWLKNEKEAENLLETSRRVDPDSGWRSLANTTLLALRFQQKKYDDVVMLFNQERDHLLESSRAVVFFQVAEAEFQRKNYLDAETACDRFLKLFPTDNLASFVAYRRVLARQQFDQDHVSGDTAAYLAKYPEAPYAPVIQRLRAEDFSRRGQFAEALPMWEKLVPKEAQDPDAWLQLARAYAETKKWKPAAEAYSRFADAFPKHPSAVNARMQQGANWQRAGNAEAALAAWELVRVLTPAASMEKRLALEQTMLLFSQQKKTADLVKASEALLAEYHESPLRAFAFYNIGAQAFEQQNYLKARNALASSRQLDPTTYQAATTARLAWASFQLKDSKAATEYSAEFDLQLAQDKTLSLLPASLYYWLGQSCSNSAPDQAITAFQKVTTHSDPGALLAPAWWELAQLYYRQQRGDEAVNAFEKYLPLQPTNAKSYEFQIAYIEALTLAKKQLEKAEALVNQLLIQEQEGPRNARARLDLGKIFEAREEYNSAAKAFASLALLHDDPVLTPQAMQAAADNYAKAGDTKSAQEWRAKRQQYSGKTN